MKTRLLAVVMTIVSFVILSTEKSQAQAAPIFSFSSYSLESGTALSNGAVYRFSNVTSGVDALVTISAVTSGITLRNIDRTIDGYGEAFQPEYRINGNTNGYIEFQIRFVTSGTSTTSNRPIVSATGLDIDGSPSGSNSLKEFNRIDMGGGSYEFNTYNAELTVSQSGTAVSGNNYTGNLFGALVDTTAKEVMFSVTNTNVGSMTYRVGSNNETSGSSTRYASLYYKKFTYQHFPLAISGLMSFEGVAVNNKVKLSWELAANKYSKVVLEKSNTSANFTKVYEANSGSFDHSGYTDADVQGGQLFYRLCATNLEGKTEYSSVIAVKVSGLVKNEMNVYPSLIQTGATVTVALAEKTEGTVLISDFSGRIVKQQKVNLQAGSNSIAVDGFDNFAKGNYIVALRTPAVVYSRKVVVQ
ncbi:MAG TPA: T9SS type A sorting domain-containing protein [Chitinophagaceae bacterium]|nr:T9SS type A sorting domain-containing protein [Chitinophagaceae bacterium]